MSGLVISLSESLRNNAFLEEELSERQDSPQSSSRTNSVIKGDIDNALLKASIVQGNPNWYPGTAVTPEGLCGTSFLHLEFMVILPQSVESTSRLSTIMSAII